MNADNATFGKFKAGKVAISIDDVAAIAKAAGDKIMEIYDAPDFAAKILVLQLLTFSAALPHARFPDRTPKATVAL